MRRETESLSENMLIQTLTRSVAKGKPTPVLTAFIVNEEPTIENSAVVLQDEIDKVLATGL